MKINIILVGRFGNVLFEIEAAKYFSIKYGVDVQLYALVNDKSSNPYAYKNKIFSEIKYCLKQLDIYQSIIEVDSFDMFENIINLSNYPFEYISIQQIYAWLNNMHTDKIALLGYFQNAKYIEHVDPIIQISNTNDIGIHIRCGDYLQLTKIFPNLQHTVYFQNALSYIINLYKIQYSNIKVFSDEPDNIDLKIFHDYKIEIMHGSTTIDDFYNFARCPYKIISNSTFAYQASILSNSKIICAPPVWNNVFLYSPQEVYLKLYRKDFVVII